MNILVCISAVPDTTTKITFTENNTKFNTEGVQFIINPYDELALTKALLLTEAHGGEVHIVTVGVASVEPIIRKSLAIGASKAFRIDIEPNDGMEVAREVAALVDGKDYQLIMTGRESIDYNGGQVAPILSELTNRSLANIVTEMDIVDDNELNTFGVEFCIVFCKSDFCGRIRYRPYTH